MINALLVLALVAQDDVAVTGKGRREGGEYELTVSGKGKGLQGQQSVTLKFRRLANRVNWEDGAIKHWVTHRGLELRRRHPALFRVGDYRPLWATGRGPFALLLLDFRAMATATLPSPAMLRISGAYSSTSLRSAR